MFRTTICPSSGETTVFVRHLVLVVLKQIDSLKLQGCMSLYEIRPCNFKLSTCFRTTSTKCRINTVVSPDDGHIVARNMPENDKYTKK